MRNTYHLLPPQKYPAAIIFINIDADQVDVNIHPKKEEIKFLHPKKIETIIVNSIKATLNESVTQQLQIMPQQASLTHTFAHNSWKNEQQPTPFSFLQTSSTSQIYKNVIEKTNTILENELEFSPQSFAAHAFENSTKSDFGQSFVGHGKTTTNLSDEASQQIQDTSAGTQSKLISDEYQEIAIIGQHKLTYILFEKDNNLVFVDQHASHERILYEQFKANFHNVATIQLMFPEFIKLQAYDILSITPYLSLLKDHGIQAEVFSDTQLIIQATPVHLKNQLLQETIRQIIGWITELDETDPSRIANLLNEKMHTKMACSAAIKAGDLLNMEQMQQLLQNLSTIENRFSCPHGRPTFWTLPIDHLEKQFKRDYGKKAEQFFDFL